MSSIDLKLMAYSIYQDFKHDIKGLDTVFTALVARAEDPVTEDDPGLASRGKTTADRSPNFRPPRSSSRNSDTFLTIVPLFSMLLLYH